MSHELREDQRLALANMHALAQATLRAADAVKQRRYLEQLADYAPDEGALAAHDPRSDAALAAGIASAPAARRFAARVRGVVLGAAAHPGSGVDAVLAMVREVVAGEGVSDAALLQRVAPAMAATREDLARDVVRLGAGAGGSEEGSREARLRRWGAVRALELNGFVAAFTRDGTAPVATAITQRGRDASALRFVLAVTQAAMSLAAGAAADASLEDDARRTEAALPVLLANLIAAAR